MTTVTNDQLGGTSVGTGFYFQCGLGIDLAVTSNAITVTDSVHYVTGTVPINNINFTTASPPSNPALVFLVCKSGSSWSFTTGGNIAAPFPVVAENMVIPCLWDGTVWHVGSGASVGGPFALPNAAGLVSENGAGNGLLGLIFADASDFVHLAYYGAAGMYVPTPNTSFGRAAIPIAHVIEYIGAGQNAAAGAYDLTSADGIGDLVGLACYPVMRLTTHGTNHYAAKFWSRSLDDGTPHTVDTQIGINILAGDKGSSTTVTTMVGLDIDEPTNGVANYGIRNSGTSWLKKNVGVGVAPSTTYTLFVRSATDSNFGVTDSAGATGAVGTLLSSLTDANTLQPMFFNASLFRFFGIVQFGTSSTPQSVAFPSKAVTCANGANTISDGGAGYVRITGPTGAFSVNGFTAGLDGQIKRVFNAVAQPMTITNEATATSAQQISTLTGSDVVLRSGKSFSSYIYDGANTKWILTGTN